MRLDEIGAVVETHSAPIEPSLERLTEIRGGHRVERARDLHVVIGMDLHGGPHGHVEGSFGRRSKQRALLALEDLARDATRGAVDAHARDLAAPVERAAACVREVEEGLSVEPSLAHERHLVLDARLVLRVTHARRIDEEPARLRVLEERAVQLRRLRIRTQHHRRGVVRHDARDDAAEELPRRVEALADRLGGLHEGRPDEHVAAQREHHDQRPELAHDAALVADRAHQAEVDLRLFARRRIVDEHRRRTLAPLELLVREATQRRVRDLDALAREKIVNAHQAQRSLAPEPRFDLRPACGERVPLVRRIDRRSRLHARGDGRDGLVVERARRREPELRRRRDVPQRRLAIDDAVARNLPRALSRLPAAEDFLDLHHAQLPKTHRCLPWAPRSAVGKNRVLGLGRRVPGQSASVTVAP